MKKLLALGLCSFSVYAAAPFRSGEVLVKVRPGTTLSGVEVIHNMQLLTGNYMLVKGSVEDLKSRAEVEFAEPNYLYQSFNSSDPLYGKLWGLNNTGSQETNAVRGADINAEKAWTLTRGSKKVVIAVIDTGIDYNHEDLKKNAWLNPNEIAGNNLDDDKNGFVDDLHGWNAFAKNGNPFDDNNHGSHCAGTIGAEHGNGVGVAGVMDEVSIMAVKFLDKNGSGSLADAIAAIDYATKMNVDIMSNSWGGGGYSKALEDAIKAAKDRGILFVAAAGNSSSNNDTEPTYPANYEVDNIISVAAHTSGDQLATFSCFGKRTVHVAAPGLNILSTTPNNQYQSFSGTSMATPHVAGVLGLLVAQEGRLPVLDVRERIMATSVPVTAYRRTTLGGGRVDAYNLLTDTRIPRQGPDEHAWKTVALDVFETTHPYKENEKKTKTYSFPGAKYVKLVVEKYDLESNYDFLVIKDSNGNVVEKLSGEGVNYETDYAETSSVTVEFSSDLTQNRWGAVIKDAKVIY